MFKCKDCLERHPGCHGTCPSYNEEKAIIKERNARIFKDKQVSRGIKEQKSRVILAARRKKR